MVKKAYVYFKCMIDPAHIQQGQNYDHGSRQTRVPT